MTSSECRRRIVDCERTLARLRGLGSSVDLIDSACRGAASGCRFSRVVLSRVDNGQWWPWVAHFEDASGLDVWAADWLDRPVPLGRTLLESQIVQERRPALIGETSSPQVHELIRAGNSTSYVVAPIVLDGEVVGLLHADHDRSRRCDETDRELLHAFAQGFGHLYERTVWLERGRTERDAVRELLADVVSALGAWDAGPASAAAAADLRGHDDLTPREREVLRLLVGGASNRTIADELLVTVGTVKSHVRRILHKLDAVNRTQAIARYLESTEVTPRR
jgi:DNA-binding CsgD family transcriptional regulator